MNEEFPRRVFFNTSVREEKPYDEVDEDAHKMNICYFTTHEQKYTLKY